VGHPAANSSVDGYPESSLVPIRLLLVATFGLEMDILEERLENVNEAFCEHKSFDFN
jgi:hypothetical protein